MAAKKLKPSVIWLHFQECTGCTESLLRTSHPAVAELILDLVSLDYCETLFAAAGHQAEEALKTAMKENAGKYVLVIEGAIPTKDNGIYCQIGGRTALEIVHEVADKAGAIIAIGSCASWGGIPSADPNPTGATGAPMILKGKTVVTIPGCPANPYNLLGTVLQYATFGTLPELDDKGRPKFAYGRTIHEHCPRRAHFDAGRFVAEVRRRRTPAGLVPLQDGLQGPGDHANCSTLSLRRSDRRLADRHRTSLLRLHGAEARVPRRRCTTTVDIERPDSSGHLRADPRAAGLVSPLATGVAGLDRRRADRRGLHGVEEARRRAARPRRRARERRAEMSLDRRNAAQAVARGRSRGRGRGGTSEARVRGTIPADALGLLYDTTKCIGCKTCVVACREANNTNPTRQRPRRDLGHADGSNGGTKNVIKLYKSADGQERSYFKAQCMHCGDPACANACMLGALQKREHGIVTYDPRLCSGCRYCQMACPFNIPKFEWTRAPRSWSSASSARTAPGRRARVDTDGFTRYPKGNGPACAEVCPRRAVISGKRDELLAEASAGSPRTRAATSYPKATAVFGETDSGRDAVPLPLARALREARSAGRRTGRCPSRSRPSSRDLQGNDRPVALYGLLGAVFLAQSRERTSRWRRRVSARV